MDLGTDYLFIRDIIRLDILEQNLLRRHIYFSFLPEEEGYKKDLTDYGHIVWEWTPVIPAR